MNLTYLNIKVKNIHNNKLFDARIEFKGNILESCHSEYVFLMLSSEHWEKMLTEDFLQNFTFSI